uniref:Glyoxalase/bleomycin resistance protein/dioxygenase n=1 Tax=Cyanothece sp. (strain PCC 7425 / ATCC 29141) TaxID=395961 RepID=B8HXQ9_CYAP4
MTETIASNFPGVQVMMPHLVVKDARAAMAFYREAFAATEQFCMMTPDGTRVMYAEVKIGSFSLALNDEFPDWGVHSPLSLQGSPVTLHLQVEDADAWFERAVAAGATVSMPLENMFWGDRYGKLIDPFGHHWAIGTQIEQLTPEEIKQRATTAFAA